MKEPPRPEPSALGRPWRAVVAALGVLCVGLAALGALLPGLPTTVFLLIASYCFAKSCPWLEERLLRRNRLFKPYLKYLDASRPMPVHARVLTMAVMWGFIAASLVAFDAAGTVGTLFTAGILAAGAAGTVAIWLFRRKVKGARPAGAERNPRIARAD